MRTVTPQSYKAVGELKIEDSPAEHDGRRVVR